MKKIIQRGGVGLASAFLMAGCCAMPHGETWNGCSSVKLKTQPVKVTHYDTNECNHIASCTCKTEPCTETKSTCKKCNVSKKTDCKLPKDTPILAKHRPLKIHVIGQGVAPCKGACSPAQSYALAKRAAIADAYRLIAERVKGVYVEGNDFIKNMAVNKSTVRTTVNATIRNANITETTFKDGLCEVEMEIVLRHSQFAQ